MAPELAVW